MSPSPRPSDMRTEPTTPKEALDAVIKLAETWKLSVLIGADLSDANDYPITFHNPAERSAVAYCSIQGLPEGFKAWCYAVSDSRELKADREVEQLAEGAT